MDKQEVINEIEKIDYQNLKYDSPERMLSAQKQLIIDIIERLDEPQKVKVKQFIAEWYEEHKHNLSNSLWEFTVELNEKTKVMGSLSEFESWFIEHPRAYEVITSMENGYEVEKEPLFYIRLTIPSSSVIGLYLGFNKDGKFDTSYGKPHITWGWKCRFTEKEIKAIDERYWAFASPVKESGKSE